MPKALVIAGTSFIGRHVCNHLREIGCKVTVTSRRGPEDDATNTIRCDLLDRDSVDAAIRKTAPDWIIQCAGATSSRDPRELYQTHIDGTLNVLLTAHQIVPDAAICIFGSAAEYGPVSADRLPVTEDTPCEPTTFFGASKLAQTHLAQASAATNGQKIVVVRPFNVIGPGLPDFYFASSLARRLAQLRADAAPPETTFDLCNADATRDFIDARDVATAVSTLLRAIDSDSPSTIASGDLFNLATGQETPLIEVATLLGELAGGYVPQPAGEVESRGGINRSAGDATRLSSVSSRKPDSPWQARITWQTSIRDLWDDVLRSR
ncbi:MAG: NAD-dependent epimerase/dehydratase family protein [Planctomycetota bacterium]|jgi:GDP-4-dehydro-6-deoxy-D-mannose reductase